MSDHGQTPGRSPPPARCQSPTILQFNLGFILAPSYGSAAIGNPGVLQRVAVQFTGQDVVCTRSEQAVYGLTRCLISFQWVKGRSGATCRRFRTGKPPPQAIHLDAAWRAGCTRSAYVARRRIGCIGCPRDFDPGWLGSTRSDELSGRRRDVWDKVGSDSSHEGKAVGSLEVRGQPGPARTGITNDT